MPSIYITVLSFPLKIKKYRQESYVMIKKRIIFQPYFRILYIHYKCSLNILKESTITFSMSKRPLRKGFFEDRTRSVLNGPKVTSCGYE